VSHMENPATLVACWVPETDLASASITPDITPPLIHLQVARLTRRCAITAAMGEILAPLVFGGTAS